MWRQERHLSSWCWILDCNHPTLPGTGMFLVACSPHFSEFWGIPGSSKKSPGQNPKICRWLSQCWCLHDWMAGRGSTTYIVSNTNGQWLSSYVMHLWRWWHCNTLSWHRVCRHTSGTCGRIVSSFAPMILWFFLGVRKLLPRFQVLGPSKRLEDRSPEDGSGCRSNIRNSLFASWTFVASNLQIQLPCEHVDGSCHLQASSCQSGRAAESCSEISEDWVGDLGRASNSKLEQPGRPDRWSEARRF